MTAIPPHHVARLPRHRADRATVLRQLQLNQVIVEVEERPWWCRAGRPRAAGSSRRRSTAWRRAPDAVKGQRASHSASTALTPRSSRPRFAEGCPLGISATTRNDKACFVQREQAHRMLECLSEPMQGVRLVHGDAALPRPLCLAMAPCRARRRQSCVGRDEPGAAFVSRHSRAGQASLSDDMADAALRPADKRRPSSTSLAATTARQISPRPARAHKQARQHFA